MSLEIHPAAQPLPEARNEHLIAALRPMALGLALLYLAMVPSHLLFLEGPARTVMTLMAAFSAALGAFAWVKLGRVGVDQRLAHPLAVGLIGITLANSLTQLGATGSLLETTNVMLILVGVGSLLLSRRWFVGFVAVSLLGWAIVALPLASDPAFSHWLFALLIALLLAAVLHTVRMNSVTRLLALRNQDRQRNRALQQANHEARSNSEKLQAVLDSSLDGIVVFESVVDAAGEITDFLFADVNRAATSILERSADELVGRHLRRQPQGDLLFEQFVTTLASGRSLRSDLEFADEPTGGASRWFDVSAVPLDSKLVVTFSDITGRKERERSAERLANHDPLTGLLNRRAFVAAAEAALRLAQRDGGTMALLLIDLDGFKPINDRHGHPVGDEVLREIAGRLRDTFRASDLVARIGGDEFVVLMQQAGPQGVTVACRRLLTNLERPIDIADGATRVTVGASIGCARYPDSGGTIEMLLTLADRAMYEAKASKQGIRFAPAGV